MLSFLFNVLSRFLSSSFFLYWWWYLLAFGVMIGIVHIIRYFIEVNR